MDVESEGSSSAQQRQLFDLRRRTVLGSVCGRWRDRPQTTQGAHSTLKPSLCALAHHVHILTAAFVSRACVDHCRPRLGPPLRRPPPQPPPLRLKRTRLKVRRSSNSMPLPCNRPSGCQQPIHADLQPIHSFRSLDQSRPLLPPTTTLQAMSYNPLKVHFLKTNLRPNPFDLKHKSKLRRNRCRCCHWWSHCFHCYLS